MGILKSLSSMSEGAKRNLNALAAKFNNKNKSTTPAETGLEEYEDVSPRSNDRRGLLAHNEEGDDDDDEEEILFNVDAGQNRHALDERGTL